MRVGAWARLLLQSIGHLSVDGGGEGCKQDLVESPDAAVRISGRRECHDTMPFKAVHELMRHDAVGAEQIRTIEAASHCVVLFALASRAMRT